MKLTPLDIRKQEFKRAVRGLDIDEVETFLDMVAEQFESLLRERNELSEQVVKLRTQLRDYQQVEKTLKETLMNAQQNINESRATSKREAELIVREAELKAEEILEDSKSQLLEMKNDLRLLRAQRDSFVRRLRQLLQSQVELIDVLGSEDLGLIPHGDVSSKPLSAHVEDEASIPAVEPRIVGLQDEKEEAESPQSTDESASEEPPTEKKPNPAKETGRDKKLSDEFIV